MKDQHGIIDAYEQGLIERDNGSYLKAARYFRIAYMIYENCDMYSFCEGIKEAGSCAFEEFNKVMKLLSKSDRDILRNEQILRTYAVTDYSEAFAWGWENLVRHDYQMIFKKEILSLDKIDQSTEKVSALGSIQ